MRTHSEHRKAARSAGTRRCVLLTEGGHTLVAVLAISTSVLLVGTAIFTLGQSEGDLVEYAMDDARAFYVAEGGLERARGWLGDLFENDPSADPVGMSFTDQSLGGGSYSVEVTDNLSGSWIPAYEVVCSAEVSGVTRCVRNVMIPETFARFQWFKELNNSPWLGDHDSYDGPVHINRRLRISGDPHFGGPVTMGMTINVTSGSEPTFERGYQQNVEQISLPTVGTLRNSLRVLALNGGTYGGTLPGNSSFYHVELGSPSVGEFTYTGLRPQGSGYTTIDGPHTVDISTVNGVVWFEEPMAIEGVLDGQLTVFADGHIYIWDDIVYDDSTIGSGPNPGCDDVLGLIADGDVRISYTAANQSDCEIHGVVMALNRDFEAERWGRYVPRGDLVVYGGFAVDRNVIMGLYNADGSCRNGYNTYYHWDSRLVSMPPPHYPLTNNFIIDTWEEVDPPEA